MKVALNETFRTVRVVDRPVPTIGPGEALAKVTACGVCTGEAMPWYVNRKCPTVLGHEPVGVIVRVGRGVRKFKVGDRVFFHHHTSCGACSACRRGHPTLCREFRETKLDPGGFSEFVRIPKLNLEKDTLLIPKSVPDESAVLIEPLGCGIHAMKRAGIRRGDTVLVIGLGVMGLLNIQLAKQFGAERVIGCDLKPARRRLGLKYGAAVAIPPNLRRLKIASRGKRVDSVIVGPPSSAALEFGASAAAPGATILLFAPIPPDSAVRMNFHDLYFREQTIATSYSCDASDTQDALKLLNAKKIKTAGLITHRYGLSGVGDALWKTWKGSDGIVKAVVYPN